MRLSLAVFNFIGLSACLLASQSSESLGEFKKYSERTWDFTADNSYYSTQNNYLRSGNSYDSLPNGGSYSLFKSDLSTRWNISKAFAITAGTTLAAAESRDGTLTRTTSQFDRLFLGADFIIYDGSFRLIPDLSLTAPLTKTEASTNTVQTSDGATEATGRIIAQFNFKNLNNQAFIGTTYRDGGRSLLLNYGAGAELKIGTSNLGAELKGYSSIINDTFTSNPTSRESNSLRVNGGSFKFNSINPSLMESNFWYRWDNAKWGLQFGFGLSITGTAQSMGYQGFLNYVYHFQSKDDGARPVAPLSDLERFKEQTNDGVDQILFQPEPPPEEASRPSPKIKRQRSQPEIQIQLKPAKAKRKKKAAEEQ